jgi:hypothetical protein
MRVKGDWEGISGFWIDDPQSPDGQRWIATAHGWTKVQARLRELANGKCELNLSEDCMGAHDPWPDSHHRRGRGTGGSKRDDRIVISGKRNLLLTCRPCHQLAKIETKAEIFG